MLPLSNDPFARRCSVCLTSVPCGSCRRISQHRSIAVRRSTALHVRLSRQTQATLLTAANPSKERE